MPTDTILVQLHPNEAVDHSDMFQQALEIKKGRVLKIFVSKGKYKVSRTLATTRTHTIIVFDEGAKVFFSNNSSSGFLFRHDYSELQQANIYGNGISAADFYSGYGVLIHGADNCKIVNSKFFQTSGVGILLFPNNKGSNDNIIAHNRFVDPVFSISKSGDEAAILLGYSGSGYSHDNNKIIGNYIDGGEILKVGVGIIGHGNNNIIQNNEIQDCLAYGIVVYESIYAGGPIKDTKIIGNYIKKIGERGTRSTVKGMGIYLLRAFNTLVENNTIEEAMLKSDKSETLGAGAISVSVSPNCTLRGNSIINSHMYGIVSAYSFGSHFENNRIRGSKKSAMYIINSNDISIINNHFESKEEVMLKGFFQNTKKAYDYENWIKDKYYGVDTGKRFIIKGNTFYGKGDILLFVEDSSQKTIRNSNQFANNMILEDSNKKRVNFFGIN